MVRSKTFTSSLVVISLFSFYKGEFMENLDKDSWDIIHSLSFAGLLSDLLTEEKLQMDLRGHWENKFSSYLKDRFIESEI